MHLDGLLQTTDTTFIPTSFGPPETERQLGSGGLVTPLTRTIVYTYDNLYRLTEADYTSGESYAYSYDSVGNRLQQITAGGNTTTYQYDAANRLEQVTVSGQSPVSYTFDDNGNLLQTGVMTNSWDAANRLIETERAGSTLEPIYNGVNDRVGQTTSVTTTYFALDVMGLPEVIYTTEDNLYLHLPGVIMAESGTGEIRYLLSDGLGSVRQATDESGEVVAYNEFDPYGNPVQNDSSPYGFTGEWWESNVNLLHLRARWYAPETGTFVSKDTWQGHELRPMSMNGWSYVEGNPVNRVDPSGYQTACDENGYCPEIDRYLCAVTPSGYDSRGLPCIVNPENVQIGNAPPTFQPPAATFCIPTSPANLFWQSCQDDRDLTNWLYRELTHAVNKNPDIETLRRLYSTPVIIGGSRIAGADLELSRKALALEGWASLVRDNHRFDFKHAIRREFRSEIILFRTSTGLPFGSEYSVPGNIFFAYVGRSIGFGSTLLHAGAGWAEGTDPGHVDDPNRWVISVCNTEFGFYANPEWAGTLFDDPVDYQVIEFGSRLWDKYQGRMTEYQFISELEQNRPQLTSPPVEYGGNPYGWRNPRGGWPYDRTRFNGTEPSWLFDE